MRYIERLLLWGLFVIVSLPVFAQTDINRYTLFTGFDYMISPARNLTERGFESDFGVTVKPWLGMGVDVGILGGAGTINGGETVYAPPVNALLGPGAASQLHVPFNSSTYTFAAGPQFYIRKWQKVTFLIGRASVACTRRQTSPSQRTWRRYLKACRSRLPVLTRAILNSFSAWAAGST